MKERKVYITGTGRSGTTFLIILLTHLNMNTGFKPGTFVTAIDKKCNSGMEKNFNSPPYIIKSPHFMQTFHKIIETVDIDQVIIPIRNYEDSAESRERFGNGAGGLWGAKNKGEQVTFYHKIMAEYLLWMTRYDIPTIFIDFDRMVTSSEYLYEKLKPILKDITYDVFKVAYMKATNHQKKK